MSDGKSSPPQDPNRPKDDGRPWGHIVHGRWLSLPKAQMLSAGLGPPPFWWSVPNTRDVLWVCNNPSEPDGAFKRVELAKPVAGGKGKRTS